MSASSRVEAALPPPSSKIDRLGVAALIAGTAITAWSGVQARFLDVGPLAGAAWRMGLAVPALAAWMKFAEREKLGGAGLKGCVGLLILAGLAFAVDIGTFHISLTGTNVANASFIGNIAPVFTVVGGALIFRERPTSRVWLALGCALVGAWVMAGMLAPAEIGFGDANALASAVGFAAYLLLIKRLREKLDGATATLWSAAAIALAVAAWLRGETMVPSTALGWAIVVTLGVVTHAMGQGFTSVALGRAPVALVALVILAQPPFSALIAWGVLGEAMTALQIAGGAVILASVLLSGPPTAAPSPRSAPSETPRR